MLIPKEQPYLKGLNSYYLQIDRFIEHLQGEIGSGCLYFDNPKQEMLLYFDEQEVVRSLIQDKGKKARVSLKLQPLLPILTGKNFRVTVYQLDENAIFYWGQIPPFQRVKTALSTASISLSDLLFRLKQKRFCGFVEVAVKGNKGEAVLFFNEGKRLGGSYSWGVGGLTGDNESYNRLLSQLQAHEGSFTLAHFLPSEELEEITADKVVRPESKKVNIVDVHLLEKVLWGFLELYGDVIEKKTKADPVLLLKQQFVDHLHQYPFLDPFQKMFHYSRERVAFSPDAPREKIARAIVECVWQVVKEKKMEKNFRAVLEKWQERKTLEKRGILLLR